MKEKENIDKGFKTVKIRLIDLVFSTILLILVVVIITTVIICITLDNKLKSEMILNQQQSLSDENKDEEKNISNIIDNTVSDIEYNSTY